MITGISFKYSNTVGEREARKWKIVPQAGSARKNIRTEIIDTCRYFNTNTIRDNFKSTNMLKFMQSR